MAVQTMAPVWGAALAVPAAVLLGGWLVFRPRSRRVRVCLCRVALTAGVVALALAACTALAARCAGLGRAAAYTGCKTGLGAKPAAAPPAEDWYAGLTVQDGGFAQPLEARAALLIDITQGCILYRKAADEPLAPASTAKLLTALTAWALCGPDELVTAGSELGYVAADASRAGLAAGDTLTLRQLTCAMLLPSGNDAAYALAAYAGRVLAGPGCPDETALACFVQAMNEQAAALGACGSCFATPDGYDADGQYTTAADLARIACAFLQNEELAALAAQPSAVLELAGGRQLACRNTNLLLDPAGPWYDPCVTGLKTGRTSAAGCCLISSARTEQGQYLCVVMGSSETGRWADSLALLRSVGA